MRLRELLEAKRYDVGEADDAAQALTLLERERPDIVLLESVSSRSERDAEVDALRAHPETADLPLIVLAPRHFDAIDPLADAERGLERLLAPISDADLLARVHVALRASRLQAEQRRRNDQLSALVQVMEAANSTLDVVELAEGVVERVLFATQMLSASIWLRDDDDALCLARRPPGPPDAPERLPLTLATPLGRAITTGKPEFADGAPAAPGGYSAVLPLLAGDELIGALAIDVPYDAPIPDDERAVLSVLAAHIAVAIRHAQIYQQAELQRRQLQEIDQQKDEFISITSHELKNPMASIKGYADLMLRRSGKSHDDPNRKGLEIISQQVSRMTALLDQLLDVSRIGMDRLQLDQRPADLAVIITRIVDEMRATADQHQLHLDISDAPLMGDFDEVRIGQAVGNLLSNAIKYSPDGGDVWVRLERGAHAGRECGIVAVQDHGIGIPAEDREHLFERFFRARNVGPSFAGMGLGLFITRGVVERHGGRISLESEEGQGTTFLIELPLDQHTAPIS